MRVKFLKDLKDKHIEEEKNEEISLKIPVHERVKKDQSEPPTPTLKPEEDEEQNQDLDAVASDHDSNDDEE